MRNLKRNQQTIFYRNYESCEDEYDEYGNLTGSQIKKFGEIKKCEIVTKNGKKCMEKFTIDEYDFLCSLCIGGKKYD